ncbi:MAG: hypothetical protein ACOX7U_01115 [Desulfitobacteriia bacterium]
MNQPYKCRFLPWIVNTCDNVHSGQLFVNMDCQKDSRLELYNCDGTRLPAYLLYSVLQIALPNKWPLKLENQHLNRQTWWKVESYRDSKGNEEYWLCTREGENKAVCSSKIRISKGQIHTFSILAPDAPPLFQKIFSRYPPVFNQAEKNKKPNFHFPPHYINTMELVGIPGSIKKQREETGKIMVDNCLEMFPAGVKSEMLETLAALNCWEVLLA